MATPTEFFNNPKNLRACLLYEFLRGLTPRETLNELKKASFKSNEKTINEICQLFWRFKSGNYDITEDINKLPEPEGEEYDVFLNKNKKLEFIYTDTPVVNSFIKELDPENVKLVEINADSSALPKNITIGIDFKSSKQSVKLEIYRASNGVVFRSGRESHFLEGEYDFMRVATKVIVECLKRLAKKETSLKLILSSSEFNVVADDFYKFLIGDNQLKTGQLNNLSVASLQLSQPSKSVEDLFEIGKCFQWKKMEFIKYKGPLNMENLTSAEEAFDKCEQAENCEITFQDNTTAKMYEDQANFPKYRQLDVSSDKEKMMIKKRAAGSSN